MDGFINLIQSIIGILKFSKEYSPLSNATRPHQELYHEVSVAKEFVEEMIDMYHQHVKPIMQGLLQLLQDPAQRTALITFLQSFAYKHRYTFIFICGSLAFDLVVEALFIYFTAGGGNLANALGESHATR